MILKFESHSFRDVVDSIHENGFAVIAREGTEEVEILKAMDFASLPTEQQLEFITVKEFCDATDVEDVTGCYGSDEILGTFNHEQILSYIEDKGYLIGAKGSVVGPELDSPLWADQISELITKIIDQKGELGAIAALEGLI